MDSRGLVNRPDDNNQDVIAITPRAIALWDMVRDTSALLECYRESVFRRNSNRYSLHPSHALTNDQVFIDSSMLAIEIAETEYAYLRFAKQNDREGLYESLFGKDSFARRVAAGLLASYNNYYRDETRIPKELQECNSHLMVLINNIEGL
jgi:hypothetical protein